MKKLLLFLILISSACAGSDLYPPLSNFSFSGLASWTQPRIASGTTLPEIASAATGELFLLYTPGTSTALLYRMVDGEWGPVGGAGGGGVSDHALLANLDYDNSGHTGFQREMATATVVTDETNGMQVTPPMREVIASLTFAGTIKLPAAASCPGYSFVFANRTANLAYVYVADEAPLDTIGAEGITYYTLAQYDSVELTSDGENLWIVKLGRGGVDLSPYQPIASMADYVGSSGQSIASTDFTLTLDQTLIGGGGMATSTVEAYIATETSDRTAADASLTLDIGGKIATQTVIDFLATRTFAVSTITASYTVLPTDRVLLASAAGGIPFTFTLPAASANTGRPYTFARKTGSTPSIWIAGNGGDTIVGVASIALTQQWESVDLVSDGVSEWSIK